jgi:hypothetical protein
LPPILCTTFTTKGFIPGFLHMLLLFLATAAQPPIQAWLIAHAHPQVAAA